MEPRLACKHGTAPNRTCVLNSTTWPGLEEDLWYLGRVMAEIGLLQRQEMRVDLHEQDWEKMSEKGWS
jgi:hypothetical protein